MLTIGTMPILLKIVGKLDIRPIEKMLEELDIFEDSDSAEGALKQLSKEKVGILGATGEVGREMMKILAERKFPIGELHLLASEHSVGKEMEFCGKKIAVFGESKAESLAKKFAISETVRLPIDPFFASAIDVGAAETINMPEFDAFAASLMRT